MTNFPLSGLPLLGSAVKNNVVTANEQLAWLDVMTGGKLKSTTNTPPASPANGDLHLVGSSPTGVWSTDGASNRLAFYFNGWLYFDPKQGQHFYDNTAKEHLGYDETWGYHPLQARWSATEHWTGEVHGGVAAINRVWSKTITTSTNLPNSTSKNFAHGISNLDVDAILGIEAIGFKSTDSFLMPGGAGANIAGVLVDATNIVVTTNFTAAAYEMRCRLKYRKTV